MITQLFEKFISKTSIREITIGAEMEVYLIDYSSEPKLVRDYNLTKDIYDHFDERIYKNAQEYQLEIRTNPSDDPNEVVKEMCNLMKQVSKVAKQYQCRIAPVGWIKDKYFEGSFCGFHIHITPKHTQTERKEMVKLLLAIYPFIYTVARLSLSAPFIDSQQNLYLSKRILQSDSIGLPNLQNLDYLPDRYADITINTNVKQGRERIKDVETIEVRIFDPVGSSKCLEAIIHAMYQLARKVRTDFAKDIIEKPSIHKAIQQARQNLIKPNLFVDPLTKLTPYQFLLQLNIKTYFSDSWIKYHFSDWLNICNAEFHIRYLYPL